MNKMDLDELLLEATEYPGWSSWCGDIINRLAAALAEASAQNTAHAEREIAKAWDEGFRTAALGISAHHAAPNDAPDA